MKTSKKGKKADLFCTKDYDLFELHENNRPERVRPDLEESMRKYGFKPGCAINVQPTDDGKFKIIQGHHRFACARKLGIELWYIIDYSNCPITIFELEGASHQSWKMNDFANAYCSAGVNDYQTLIDFAQRHKLSLAVAASLCGGESAGSGNKTRHVKTGMFKIGNMDHAYKVVRITDSCHLAGIPFASKDNFVAAVSVAIFVPGFEVEVFVAKVKQFPGIMIRRSLRNDFLEEIEKLYNHCSRERRLVGLKSIAVELAKQRSAAFSVKKKPESCVGQEQGI